MLLTGALSIAALAVKWHTEQRGLVRVVRGNGVATRQEAGCALTDYGQEGFQRNELGTLGWVTSGKG